MPTQHMMRYTAQVSLYEPVYLLNTKIDTNFRLLSYFISNIHLRLLGFAAISCYIKTVYTLSKTSNALRKCQSSRSATGISKCNVITEF